jgi:hypothetical protein
MDYVEWVDHVARTFAAAEKRYQQLDIASLAKALGLSADNGQLPNERHLALGNALDDLTALGILEQKNSMLIRETENTRRLRAGARLETTWKSFFEPFLESEHSAFLEALVGISQQPATHWADVVWTTAHEVFSRLAWSTSERDDILRAHEIASVLEEGGLIRARRATGSLGALRLRPTYRGVVRATRQDATEWQERLEQLVAEWETVTVDFKEQLSLKGQRQKAEFVKDVLALATTKASGAERYMIVGFDDETRSFTTPFDATINEDQLEDVINAYLRPPQPRVRLNRVPMGEGEAGVIEIVRDARHIPYRVTKAIQKLKIDDVFVRHGTHSTRPSDEELADLLAEAERANAE